MERYGYGKFLRITSCIQRFLQNYNILQLERKSGPLATKELESSEILWVRTIQTKTQDTPKFKDDTEKLNFQLDKIHRIYICKDHITGDYPIYIPSNTMMSKKLIAHANLKTLHVGSGIHNERGQRKILDSKVTSAHKMCKSQVGCKRFRVVACPAPAVGDLLLDQTNGSRQFQVIGINFAGPLIYIRSEKQEEKAYILVYSCNLTQAV